MKIQKWFAAAVAAVSLGANAGVYFAENFDNVAGLTANGWVITNASTPVGATNWFQGNAAPFPSQAGAPGAYAAANYLSTSPAGGDISTWLITPVIDILNGVTLSFWTRTDEDIDLLFSDRLNIRVSTAGTSTALASFSNVVFSVNPTLAPGSGYPTAWTQYSVVLSGISASPVAGRVAFEYNVPGNSLANYIGLDTVSASVVPVPGLALLFGLGIAAMTLSLRRAARPTKL